MSQIKLAIADDQKIFRKGIIATISGREDIRVVAEAACSEDLCNELFREDADIALLNVKGTADMKSIKRLRSAFPRIKILAISLHEEESCMMQILEAGANGHIKKNAEPDDILNAIEKLSRNSYFFNDHVSSVLLRSVADGKQAAYLKGILSPSEVNVLRLICTEHTNSEIAEKLNMGVRTVDGHRNRILAKTGSRNTAGLVMFAVRNGYAELLRRIMLRLHSLFF